MKLSWDDINIPWVESDEFVDAVLDKTSMLDILDHCGLEYVPASSGEFSYKMRCPFPWHADGMERTASFYISSEQNSFYCFGCNYNGNTISFVQYYLGKPEDKAVEWLASFAGISGENLAELGEIKRRIQRKPEETIEFYTSRCSNMIRKWLASVRNKEQYGKYCLWADKQFVHLDQLMDLEDVEWEKAKDKFTYINERIGKYLT